MPQSTFRNHILKALTPADFALVRPSLHPVVLGIKTPLVVANEPIKLVYFPEAGVASVVATLAGGHQSEVGVIGREGMTGLALALGQDRSPDQTFIQIASNGSCLSATMLRTALAESSSLRDTVLRYAHAFMIQSSRTSLVNSRSNIEERLARWLLMAHDRVDSNRIELTHEFLAMMLGTRRPGVTTAMQMLEYRGLISAKRGAVEILDRAGLVIVSNGAYGEEEQRPFRKLHAQPRESSVPDVA
ncbi:MULTISPECIES: Crp/Fnr family transcriptional regulator [unclassified Mesorhizobium]|uniref:Crp/Fnr family transcriptional regulator n=1 Tax=unclassified Mesorhizobium TaxID=325217 RepID=UPI001CCDDD83|nr:MULTISPECIES: Crp/Fnr family transcriptional regulator [unclassified Mesorhizobium]MBZ9683888.1 Crp/Fnr family transcriptional regulator [Mesorhizobium sp. CO1-1-2]MBZ9699095.1 Crp/Fnr family transcriptional regulator [Mesorhizobium sp. CO1-1-9]MBZ9725383.1 Crp/Fnr family transcriptional regulator [Mesorhizobium sp. CO1-1-11]MBZ9923680.1 Crp/Fnr family transcriptional regulator [Mesorhizobium sp. BR1-1-4]